MSRCLGAISVIVIATLGPSGASAERLIRRGTIAINPERDSGVVATSIGGAVVWRANGVVQILGPDDRWSPVIRVPLSLIDSVTEDDAGTIINGQ
jgi:hypothetical protein